jgi:hypothetical protein
MAQYYPKSQIKPNLYTNGDEYALSTNKQPYTGPYYSLSNGQLFTGNFPGQGKNIQLITLNNSANPQGEDENTTGILYSIPSSKDSNVYTSLTKNRYSSKNIPISVKRFPTNEDYKIGEFQRYFCKKNTSNLYLEIDVKVYENLVDNSSNIAFELYTPISFPWRLTGNNFGEVYNTNKSIIFQKERKEKLYGFSQYFNNDFSEFYKPLTSTSSPSSTPLPSSNASISVSSTSTNLGGSGY